MAVRSAGSASSGPLPCRRVARRISFATASAGFWRLRIWVSSSFLRHYDETHILLKSQPQSCTKPGEGGQPNAALGFWEPVPHCFIYFLRLLGLWPMRALRPGTRVVGKRGG